MRIISLFLGLFLAGLVAVPSTGLAQDTIIKDCDCEQLPPCSQIVNQKGSQIVNQKGGSLSDCAKYCCGEYEISDFVMFLIKISDFILGIVGSLALLFIIYGGVLFLISGGNKDTVAKGKRAIVGAVIGLILVFLSFTIINFVMEGLNYERDGFGQWNKVPQSAEQ